MTPWWQAANEIKYWSQGIIDAKTEKPRTDTRTLLENPSIVSRTDTCLTGYNCQKRSGLLTKLEHQMETSSLPSDLNTSIHRLFSSERKNTISYGFGSGRKLMKYTIPWDCHRRSCVLSLSGWTQSKARHRRCCQRPPAEKASRCHQTQQHVSKHAIQSLCSEPFSLTMMNFVIENWSKRPKTTEAHFWRHLLRIHKSTTGCSTNFSRYPLPANSPYVLRSTRQPQTTATSDTEGPTKHRSCPRTATSRLACCTCCVQPHTLSGTCPGPRRTKTRVNSDPSLNSTLNCPRAFTQFTTRNKIHGYISFNKTDSKQDISNENVERKRIFPERIRGFPETNPQMIRNRYGY